MALIFSRRQAGRIEQAVEADRGGDVGAAAREVERAHAAEAIAGDDDLSVFDLVEAARQLEHCQQPPAQRGAVGLQPVHLAEHRVARGAAEFLAEQVGDEGVVAELDQLPAEADLEVGDAHHGRDQDDRRPRLAVAAADEHALELLAFEIDAGPRVPCSCHLPRQFGQLGHRVHVARGARRRPPGCAACDRPCPLG